MTASNPGTHTMYFDILMICRCSNTVKLLLRYYQVKFESKRKGRNSSGIRAKLFLRLGLEDLFRETLSSEFYSECVLSMSLLPEDHHNHDDSDEKRISKSTVKEDGVFARSIDEDDTLPPAVTVIYKSLSVQIRSIYVQLNSICMSIGINSTDSLSLNKNSTTTTTEQQESTPPRKVRPITQVPASDLKQQKLQKQLRQWFWWRYGSQKDLVDALNSYILEQLLFPQFPLNENRAQVKSN